MTSLRLLSQPNSEKQIDSLIAHENCRKITVTTVTIAKILFHGQGRFGVKIYGNSNLMEKREINAKTTPDLRFSILIC